MLHALSYYYPDSWTASQNYDKDLHVLFDVARHTSEFINIASNDDDIIQISRVQHPLAYLRYILQDEYLRSRDENYFETIKYHMVDIGDLKEALDYNCDIRRYSNDKCTVFADTCPTNLTSDFVVVILKFRNSPITTDNNHYPMYVLYY